MQPDISIVIRAYNEAGPLQRLLSNLAEQEYPTSKMELVVVDNGSTDETATVAKKAGAKMVHLPQENFSYPKSSNLGVAASTAPIAALISAHCLPVSNQWIQGAICHFSNPEIAGVYGSCKAFPDAPFAEKWLYTDLEKATKNAYTVDKMGPGVFATVSAALRRTLWEQRPFNEAYGQGGEDQDWGRWALSQGYQLMYEPDLNVYHSHNLGFIGVLQQWKDWLEQKNPKPFEAKRISYRKDINR